MTELERKQEIDSLLDELVAMNTADKTPTFFYDMSKRVERLFDVTMGWVEKE